MLGRLSRIVSILAAGGLLLAGCGDEQASATPARAITVFAATSLTGAFTQLAERFEATRPAVTVRANFAASSALVRQLHEGAPADVVALADASTMRTLRERHAVRPPVTMARNRLAIVTRPGNPTKIKTLGDLARANVVALCAANVPCGRYTDEALRNAGVRLGGVRVTRGQNVAAALAAVAEGDADAAVVYATDARAAADRVTTVRIPDHHNVDATYPLAITTRARNTALAREFVAFVRGPAGRRILRAHGFLPA